MLYKARNNVIKFYDDYPSIISKAKQEATKGKGLKILTPKTNASKITNSSGTNKSR